MASYTVSSGERAAHAKTLVASTVDTVTFPRWTPEVEVISHDGAAAIYFTVDGSTPTVGGGATYMLPAAVSAKSVRAPQTRSSSQSQALTATVVKLISAGTPTYSVQEA